jgi:transposase
MQDKDLYSQILGVHEPWQVTDVKTDMSRLEITIQVQYDPELPVKCPECQRTTRPHDHKKRRWRHLDTCQMMTIIECDVPRADCPTHGTKQIPVSWAEGNSRFTALFEALAIMWMKNASITAVSDMFGISWHQAARIQEKAVRRGMARRKIEPVKDLGIDETSYQKRHEYVTVLLDNEHDRVIDVLEDRRSESLDLWLKGREDGEKAGFRTVTMDMWDPYIKAIRDNVPNAEDKICFDPFHVAQHFNKALDKVRAEEHRKLLAEDGESCLTRTKYAWLRNAGRMDNRGRLDFMRLAKSNLKTSRAWAIKETAAGLWVYKSLEWARKAWMDLCRWISRCRLEPVIKVGKMIKNYLWGILNAIIMRANNARVEGKNARIQKIKAMACGFRNRKRFKMAIMFHLGGLDMMPQMAKACGFAT